MGNAHGKESREDGRRIGPDGAGGSSAGAGYHGDLPDRLMRSSRQDLGPVQILGGTVPSPGSRPQPSDAPFERKETRAEREARRKEREQAARIKERERSMKEEHVDGGFVVTVGVYSALEDFSKPVVRQLIIERKIAPFWRGLEDFETTWAEHQIIAAARGLEVPPPDEVPEGLVPQPWSTDSPGFSQQPQSLDSLTVPMGPRTMSAASDKAGSNPVSSLPSPTFAIPRPSSSFKPKKAIAAALSISSRNGSQQDIAPREINLPQDPFVNGQPLEVFLYKDGIECPVCFLYYPKFLNKTRCCDQYICSECFVQIKRPDPHLPEHHGDQQNQDGSGPGNGTDTPVSVPGEDPAPGEFIMEPASCPYCTQTEFGITYEPPPFRRGLTYQFNPASGAMGTAMSSTSSLNSGLSPTSGSMPALAGRRRAQSLSANAPGVITCDRIRPDWTTKLANARQQQRRRAAAADALHHAAFVIGQNESARSIFGRSGRFSRRNTGSNSRGTESPGAGLPRPGGQAEGAQTPTAVEGGPEGQTGARTGPPRERIDAAHLESLMMAEAIRLSLVEEEERRKKAEKDAKKEAKKKEKEDKKASKRKSNVYGNAEGMSSASGSSLSLGFGRRRGNSTSQLGHNLRVAAATGASQSNEALAPVVDSPVGEDSTDKGKGVERTWSATSEPDASSSAATGSLPIPTGQRPRGMSHLRQMSNASSVSGSDLDSLAGSYTNRNLAAEDPRASGVSMGANGNRSEEEVGESMFNFRSLAQMVGVPIDGEDPADSSNAATKEGKDREKVEHVEEAQTRPSIPSLSTESTGQTQRSTSTFTTTATSVAEDSRETKEGSSSAPKIGALSLPSVMITPETPAALDDSEADFKQLGHSDGLGRANEVTQ